MTDEPRTASELERLWESDDARAVLEAIMRFTPGISVIASSPDRVLYVSEFASRLIGRPRSELENVRLEEHFSTFVAVDDDGRRLRDEERPVVRALGGETVIREEGAILVGGVPIPVVCNAAPMHEAQGRIIGAVLACSDVRHEKRLERDLRNFAAEREVLYRELTHRVKNHLLIMAAVTSLESREASLTSAEVAVRTGQRLQVLASVYDRMTQRDCGASIETRGFLEDLCAPYRSKSVSIEVSVSPPDLTMASDRASTFGMLVNEALCNSYKHAFPDRSGEVRVDLRRDDGRLLLSVADNGVGRGAPDPNRPSHGLKLMALHARQLAGRLEVADAPGGGTVVSVVMPVEA